jgi:hypothetical protein
MEYHSALPEDSHERMSRAIALSGLVVIVLAIGSKIRGVQTRQKTMDIMGDNNTQHDFLRRESKDVGSHVARIDGMLKTLLSTKEILRRRKNPWLFLAKFLLLRYQVSLRVTVREPWWMNDERLEIRWGGGGYRIDQSWNEYKGGRILFYFDMNK